MCVYDTIADYSKLHGPTGWEPQIDFEEGVARVYELYKDSIPTQNS